MYSQPADAYRRDFLKTIGVGAAAALAAPGVFGQETQPKKRPNVLMILVDDMGWSDIGCYGGEVNTPNIDALASKGVRFTQFHNTAKCFPSRACLLTGLYAQQVGMGSGPGTLKNCATLGEVMKSAGYRTLMTGKHHGKDNPYDRGFDRYYGLRDGACNHFNPGEQRPGEGVPAHKELPTVMRMALEAAGSEAPGSPRTWCIDDQVIKPYTPEKGFYSTDAFTDRAIGYLDEYEKEEKPFFLYVSYTAPHDPLMAWPEDIAKYRGRYLAGYEAIRNDRYEKQRDSGLIDETFPLSAATYEDWEKLSDEEKDVEDQKMAVYAAMMDRVDQNIGKLIEKLKSQGELDNTLILFASDNGCSSEQTPGWMLESDESGEIGSLTRWSSLTHSWANVSNTPFRYYKNWSHKGGACTPLIASWPAGISNPDHTSDTVGHFIDFMPTLLELAGASYPATQNGEIVHPLTGQSLVPLLADQNYQRTSPIFWQWSDGKAVRKGDYRLVSGEDGPWELYDMRTDKTETNDLSKKHPEITEELSDLYAAWEERMT